MPTLSGVNLSLNALLAHAQAIEIIEHNVANANTEGYHRQEAVMRTTVPSNLYGMDRGIGAGVRGTGVEVAQIRRFSLSFFDTRFRTVSSEASEWSVQSEVLQQLEMTLAETSSDGLLNKMDEFWNSWQILSNDPSNLSLRAKLLDDSQSLVDGFNRRAEQMIKIRTDQDLMVKARVGEINSAANRIAELNQEISRVLSVGEQPNDMMDERDMLLDRLAELAGATSSVQANGQVMVSIGGHMLVTGNETIQLQTVVDPANDNLASIQWETGASFTPRHGEISGLLTARDTIIPQQQQALDDLAVELASQINSVFSTGYGLDGTTGLNFFTNETAGTPSLYPNDQPTSALNLRLNADLTINNLAAASTYGAPGDGDLALLISNIQNSTVMSGGSATLNDFYNNQITQLGLDVQRAQINAHNQGLVVDAMSTQRESVTGVNLDEEAANLAKFQRAYQAAARVMNVYDEMLERVINGLGLVGR